MVRLSIISFTIHGGQLAKQLQNALSQFQVCCYTTHKLGKLVGIPPYDGTLQQWTEKQFQTVDVILFIGACGIAVRAIAPFVQDKTKDPAVVVMDEQGHFAISLLSGHIGNANQFACQFAEIIGATPVISTATDLNHRFAVDSWAVKQNCWIGDLKVAKLVSAALLREETVGWKSDFPIRGKLPTGLLPNHPSEIGIVITLNEHRKDFDKTLCLIPQMVVLGIGCRKDTPLEQIQQQVLSVLSRYDISIHSVKRVCSIDLKEKETGLLAFCQRYELPFQVYSSQVLNQVKGVFSTSSFVSQITGVDNVCERAACLGSHQGIQLIAKQASNGVTVAAYLEAFELYFES